MDSCCFSRLIKLTTSWNYEVFYKNTCQIRYTVTQQKSNIRHIPDVQWMCSRLQPFLKNRPKLTNCENSGMTTRLVCTSANTKTYSFNNRWPGDIYILLSCTVFILMESLLLQIHTHLTRMCHVSGSWWPPSEYSVTKCWTLLRKSHKFRSDPIRRQQQLQGRHVRNLAVMVWKNVVECICFSFWICSLVFKLHKSKVAPSPNCGLKFAVFWPSKCWQNR